MSALSGRGFLAFGLAAMLAAASTARAEETAISVQASPIERFDPRTPVGVRFGALVFRGGLVLSSGDPDFGGFSGLRLTADGARFTTVSDRGVWFRGRIVYEGDKPAGLADVVKEPVLGRDGKPVAGRRGSDTEALEISGRTAWIAAERVDELTRYALDAEGRAGAATRIPLPKAAAEAPFNEGFEALAATKAGALVLIGEKFLDAAGDNRGFVVGGKAPFAFAVKRTEDFSPTDMARLPDGDFVLMERRFVPPFSLAVRIRKIAAADIASGATVDGPVLMAADTAQTIDNFEAIAVSTAGNGGAVLTLVSDDNFSAVQRTLLLQFELR